MKDNETLVWCVALAGLISWILACATLLVLGLTISAQPDGGWSMMALLFKSLGAIVVVHVVGVLGMIIITIQRLVRHQPFGKAMYVGLGYYGLLILGALLIEGPRELMRDSTGMVKALFLK